MTSTDPRRPLSAPFPAMAAAAVRSNAISATDAQTWLDQLAHAGQRGRFFWALTMFAVAGTRPARHLDHHLTSTKETTMSLFAVHREAGPSWVDGKGAFDQPGVADHATFMNDLVDDGLLLFAGPLAGTENGRIRVLLIADADTGAQVTQRLAADPWELAQRITTTSIEPWVLFAGAIPPLPAHTHKP